LGFCVANLQFTTKAKVPGEDYIWNQALGSDGRLYGGTYPGGKLVALDLESFKTESFDNPAKPNLYLRNVSATPDGRILCQWATEKITTRLFDPKTKTFTPVPKQLEGVQVGATWNGYFVSGNTWDGKLTKSLVFKGENFEAVDPPPFPTPPGKWHVDTYPTTPKTLFLRDEQNKVYRVDAGSNELIKVVDFDLRGGLYAGTGDGGIAGVRGQDYFLLAAGATTPDLKPIPVESGPRATHFLKFDDAKNRLWGGPSFGQTLFHVDVNSKKVVNTSQVCDSGGEVYDVCFANGKTYAVAYSGGDIIEYDPDQPWDQWNNKNPRTIAHLNGKGFIRPVGGVFVGGNGKLYAGWMAKYGTYGGAISITDPKTGDTQLIENPLGEQAIAGLASDGTHLYAGTNIAANGLPNNPHGFAKFGVVDPATKKVVFEKTFAGAGGVDHVHYDPKTKLVAFRVVGKLMIFDPAKREMIDVPDAPRASASGGACPGDGTVIYASEKSIVSLDLATRKGKTLSTAPEKIATLDVAKDGTIYFAFGVNVYRVKP
jgi:streptogramin lyase